MASLSALAAAREPNNVDKSRRSGSRRGKNPPDVVSGFSLTCSDCAQLFTAKEEYVLHMGSCPKPKTNGALKRPQDAIPVTPTKDNSKSNERRVTFNDTLEYAFITPEKSSDDDGSSSSGDSSQNSDGDDASSDDESSSSESSQSSSEASSRYDASSVEERPVPCLQCNDTFYTLGDLEAHITLAHTNQYLFECPICHEKSEVPKEVKQITCPQCNQISEAWQLPDESSRPASEDDFRRNVEPEVLITMDGHNLSQNKMLLNQTENAPEVSSTVEIDSWMKVETTQCVETIPEVEAPVHGFNAALLLTATKEPLVAQEPVQARESISVRQDLMNHSGRQIESSLLMDTTQFELLASTLRDLPDLLKGTFPCPRCTDVFSSKIALQDHQNAAHPAYYTGYLCRNRGCKLKFKAYDKYIHHLSEHKLKFKCQYCEKSFSMQATLQLHFRVHTGEKPYTCDECGRAFAIKDYLTKHKRIHTGEKPYQCVLGCGAKFTQQSARKIHMVNSCPSRGRAVAKRGRPPVRNATAIKLRPRKTRASS